MVRVCGVLAVLAMACGVAGEAPFVFVSGYDKTITTYTFNDQTGALTEVAKLDGQSNPSFLAWSPSRKNLYGIFEAGGGKVASYAIAADGSLKKLNEVSSGGNGPCHVIVHPTGKWVFAANYGSGHVCVCPVKEDGSLGEPSDVQLAGKNAHMVMLDASGGFVFVPCKGSDHIAQYVFDGAAGKLKPNSAATAATAAGAGPRHMIFHPSGKYAYVIMELDNTMVRYAYNAENGLLSEPQAVPTLPKDFAGKNTTAHVILSKDATLLFGSNRGHNSIVSYKIDAGTGALTLVGHETAGGEIKTPRNYTLDLSGQYMLVANQGGNSVTVLKLDPAAGTFTKVSTLPVSLKPSFVGVMPRQ